MRRTRPRARSRRGPPGPQERQHPAHVTRRAEGLRQDPRLRARRDRTRPAPRPQGRGLRHARVHVPRAGPRRGGDPAGRSLRARRALLRDAHGSAPLPVERPRDAPRDAAHEPAAAAAIHPPRRAPAGRGHLAAPARQGHQEALPRRPSPPGGAEGAAAQPAHPGVGRRRRRGPGRAAASSAAAVGGRDRVGEPRRALRPHGVARLPLLQRPARGDERARPDVGSRRAGQPAGGRGRELHAQARGARAARPRRSAPRSAARWRSSPTRSPA